MIKRYKVGKSNSTVLGRPGRDFDWSKFHWKGEAVNRGVMKDEKDYKAPLPYKDDCLIEEGCEYLHVPYKFEGDGTIFRVRPNPTMRAGEIYRGHLIKAQWVVKIDDDWYWELEYEGLKPYMVFGDSGEEFGADLVFAHNVREAKQTAWRSSIVRELVDEIYIGLHVRLMKGDHLYKDADKELLATDIPHVILDPTSCKACELWGMVLDEKGYCKECKVELGLEE